PGHEAELTLGDAVGGAAAAGDVEAAVAGAAAADLEVGVDLGAAVLVEVELGEERLDARRELLAQAGAEEHEVGGDGLGLAVELVAQAQGEAVVVGERGQLAAGQELDARAAAQGGELVDPVVQLAQGRQRDAVAGELVAGQ